MSWNRAHIDDVAVSSANEDYAAFEAIGLSEISQAHILDAGCFDGFNTVLKFKPYGNVASVVGIDISPDNLELARTSTDDARFEWAQAAVETYDASDASFDVVYLSHVFQHVADKEKALANIYRMLKPGGFIIIKTTDDSSKVSYPDENQVMLRLFELYERYVLPETDHTLHTDRNNGEKCYTYLKRAGFENISIKTFRIDTVGRTLQERRSLFERCVYFRRKVPDSVNLEIAEEIHRLIDEWESLFEEDDYYYASVTFVAVAQKLFESLRPRAYPGFVKAGEESLPSRIFFKSNSANDLQVVKTGLDGNSYRLDFMRETDLGEVMQVETDAFPDPWTPVAYAMELRHNPRGVYVVARDVAGSLSGYIGWWECEGSATLVHIAVAPHLQHRGIGSLLLAHACDHASQKGCASMRLQVRASNAGAREFYRRHGFGEVGLSQNYFAGPDDDAIIMAKPLRGIFA